MPDRSGRIAVAMGLAAVVIVCAAGLFRGQDVSLVFVRAAVALVIFAVIGKGIGWMADRILAGPRPPAPPQAANPAAHAATAPSAHEGGTRT
ncbi:MAG: hypothetical protein V1809_03480 [Planctomycetota bacterium]